MWRLRMVRDYARNTVITAIAVFVAYKVLPGWVFIVGGVVLFLLFLGSVNRRPVRLCRRCGGSGAFTGLIWRYAGGNCPSCGGQKVHRRWGVTFFYPTRRVQNEAMSVARRGRRAAPR